MFPERAINPKTFAVIEAWVPRNLDPLIRDEVLAFVRPIVAASQPPTVASAKNRVRDASALAAWCLSIGLDLEANVVFAPTTIERYLTVGIADASDAVRRTATPNLRKLARSAAPKLQPPQFVSYSRRTWKEPYELDEIESYVRLARQQPTELRQLRLESLVCLGAGVGLMPGEFQDVQSRDVTRHRRTVVVDIGGVNARRVPALEPLGRYLFAIAQKVAPGAYLLGHPPDGERRNWVSEAIQHIQGGEGLPRLKVGRLRATWLSFHLSAIGFDMLVAAAGVRQAPSFFDLVALMPARSMDDICAHLRGVLL